MEKEVLLLEHHPTIHRECYYCGKDFYQDDSEDASGLLRCLCDNCERDVYYIDLAFHILSTKGMTFIEMKKERKDYVTTKVKKEKKKVEVDVW